MNKKFLLSLMLALFTMSSFAALTKQAQGGWYESCWMEFTGLSNSYSQYNGYVSADGGTTWTRLDGQLLRSYGSYARVEALGLKAGNNYQLKVVPVVGESEVDADKVVSENIEVRNFDRSGFAHFKYSAGIGAYNDDGTLKAGAKVFYVTAKTAKTISTEVTTSDKGAKTTCTGLQAIIAAYEKGQDKTPIAFRFIGTVNAADIDYFGSKEEGLQIKGRKADSELNMTFEGVGNDAVVYGFGFLIRNSKSVEIRNIAVKTGIDDGISLDTDNSNIWIHNIDVFYGPNKGGDQKKGDGAIDIKSNSKFVTVSYVHFWDTGKSTMCGMKSESGPNYITYHHNWFDHSDSRHARIRTMSVHMFNNYYDGIAKYGSGACTGSSVYMDRNYFRGCTKPMMISLQGADTKYGTDLKDAPTFSGENGGMIKSYGNKMVGSGIQYKPYAADNKVEFDCFEVSTPEETVPEDVTTKSGGNKYNNFDTNSSLMYEYTADNAEDVPNIVTNRTWGAGRIQGGDFEFTFTDADDTKYEINADLENKLKDYQTASKFKGFLGGNYEPADASASFKLDGASISFNNLTYTKSVSKSDTQESFEVEVTPVDDAANISTEGATLASGTTYTIAAPAAGSTTTATFTITNADAQIIYTIIIDKTQDAPVNPDEPVLDGLTIVYFEAKQPVCDNADVTQLITDVTANYSTDKGQVKYNGAEFGECMKIESSTSFVLTPSSNCTITLVTDTPDKNIKIDGTKTKTDSNGYVAINATAGTKYTITKGDTMNLFAIVFTPIATGIEQVMTTNTSTNVHKYVENGQIVIVKNGNRYTVSGLQIK